MRKLLKILLVLIILAIISTGCGLSQKIGEMTVNGEVEDTTPEAVTTEEVAEEPTQEATQEATEEPTQEATQDPNEVCQDNDGKWYPAGQHTFGEDIYECGNGTWTKMETTVTGTRIGPFVELIYDQRGPASPFAAVLATLRVSNPQDSRPCDVVLFEGQLPGSKVHRIFIVKSDFQFEEGSFWCAYFVTDDESAHLLDDEMMAFAHDKWKNGQEQPTKVEWKMQVDLYDAESAVIVEMGVEPPLTAQQAEMVNNNALERCPKGSAPREQTSYPDSTQISGGIGAPGSFACRTLYVRSDTNTVAWFVGPWDNFNYPIENARFFIAPLLITDQEILEWATSVLGMVEPTIMELPR